MRRRNHVPSAHETVQEVPEARGLEAEIPPQVPAPLITVLAGMFVGGAVQGVSGVGGAGGGDCAWQQTELHESVVPSQTLEDAPDLGSNPTGQV